MAAPIFGSHVKEFEGGEGDIDVEGCLHRGWKEREFVSARVRGKLVGLKGDMADRQGFRWVG